MKLKNNYKFFHAHNFCICDYSLWAQKKSVDTLLILDILGQ